MFYDRYKDVKERHKADKILADRAAELAKSKDINWKERVASYFVSKIMHSKVMLGFGMKKKCGRGLVMDDKIFNKIIKKTRKVLKREKPSTEIQAVKLAMKVAKKSLKGKDKSKIQVPRVIPIPRTGGFIGLVPILTAISTISSAFGGITSIIKNIGEIRDLWKKYKESKELKTGQIGNGLKIKKFKQGLGIFL